LADHGSKEAETTYVRASETEIQALYERYGQVLYARCMSILKNPEDAGDAVQDTFAKVITRWESFQGESSPLTWMYSIATNLCLNRLRNRKGRAQKREQHKEMLVGDGTSAPGAGAWEVSDTVRTLLADEDPQTQAIVVHLFFDDMTREATAKAVGLSVPTLRKRLRAFMERARVHMESGAIPMAAIGSLIVLILVLQ
jgi:RNA polymerase sigma-70 factor (ECF subfamily)